VKAFIQALLSHQAADIWIPSTAGTEECRANAKIKKILRP
jgi:hypothetical protein